MQRSHRRKIRKDLWSLLVGLLFISPWIIGFFLFLVYPVLANFYLGMTQYSGFGEPQWVGLQNYGELIRDPLFWTSFYNTFYYVILAVPLGVFVSIALAFRLYLKFLEFT